MTYVKGINSNQLSGNRFPFTTNLYRHLSSVQPRLGLTPAHALLGLVVDVVLLFLKTERLRLCDASSSSQVSWGTEACLQ